MATIKTYLISLVFNTNQASQAKFESTLGTVGKRVAAIAASLASAALAIEAAVLRTANGFDQLYYASQRTRASVTNLRALNYAFEQMGMGAGKAAATIESFSQSVRSNLGNEGMLQSVFGVKTRGADGNLRDSTELFQEFMSASHKFKYQQAQYYARNLGIDESTFKLLFDHQDKLSEFIKDSKDRVKSSGVDPERLADLSNKIMIAFRALKDEVSTVLAKAVEQLGPGVIDKLAQFEEWIKAHRGEIVDAIEYIVKVFWDLVDAIIAASAKLKPMVKSFDELAQSITGQKGLTVALELLAGLIAGSWLTRILGSFAKIGMGWKALAALLGLGAGVTFLGLLSLLGMDSIVGSLMPGGAMAKSAGMGQGALAPGETVGNVKNNAFTTYMDSGKGWGEMWSRAKGWFFKKGGSRAMPLNGSGGDSTATTAAVGGEELAEVHTSNGLKAKVAKSQAWKFQGLIDDLEAQGYQIKQLGGYSNRRNVNNPSRMSAHASGWAIDINEDSNPNKSTESDLPPNIGELAKKNHLGWGGNRKSVLDKMHFSVDPREGGDPDAKKDTDKTSEIISRLNNFAYLDKPSPIGVSPSGYQAGVEVHSSTKVEIHGATDPAATASAQKREQDRVGQELLRNVNTAFV